MELSVEVLKIIIFLIPGLLSMILLERLTVHKNISFDRFSIYSIILSYFIYLFHYIIWLVLYKVYLSVKWVAPIIAEPEIILYEFLKNQTLPNMADFLYIFVISILVAIILAYSINNKLINQLGRLLKITTKYGDESVWDYFHNKQNNVWVVVRDLKNDLMYFGWIEVFSDDGSEFDELVLQEVTVYKNSTGDKISDVAEIYFSGKREDIRIEIYKNKEE